MSQVSHTKIIWDLMSAIITDDHPVVYQYVKGKVRSRETAIARATGIVCPIFIGAYDVSKIRKVARLFLEAKEKEYKSGKIKIKAIYSNRA